MIILIFVIFLILALIDLPWLIRGKYWRELAVYSGLMLAALVLSELLVMEVPLPAVTTEIDKFVVKIFGLVTASE